MKAFISHSSRDKHIARQVAEELGELRCEYDEYTFDFELNTAAIRAAMKRSDIFILLLSKNSIKANFVKEEIRMALERRGSGSIKQVYIFSIDTTSYKELPEWLKEINVAQFVRNGKQIAHRINAYLTELEVNDQDASFYFGRENEEKELRKALAQPRDLTPIAVHVVGNNGVGRRTFLQRSLSTIAPRHYVAFIEVTIDEYDSVLDFYRKLYNIMEPANPLVAGERLSLFKTMRANEQTDLIVDYLLEMAEQGIALLMRDEGGVLQADGDYQVYLSSIVQRLDQRSRPLLLFVQTRMMRQRFKLAHKRSFHIRLPSLSEETTEELLSLTLKDMDVDFDSVSVKKAAAMADGQPFNVNFIAAYVKAQGMDVVLDDPAEILEFKIERGSDFLRKVHLTAGGADVLALLNAYRFCDLEFIMSALDATHIADDIRSLEDFCCIERSEKLYMISPPLRSSISRDVRISRDDGWFSAVAKRVIDTLLTYESDENISLSFIDAAIPDILRSDTQIPYVSSLVLPSHLLRVGRDFYDKKAWKRCVEFCRRALASHASLTQDAKIEANRLLGLAKVRIDPKDKEITEVLVKLRSFGTQTSKRVAFFIEGFRARRLGQFENAEYSLAQAFKIEPNNFHINRELSFVLSKMNRYAEAEPFARSALSISPDNPYILDALIEALEGKIRQGLPVARGEIAKLDVALSRVCEVSNLKFGAIREARRLADSNLFVDAISSFNTTIKDQSTNIDALCKRGETFTRQGDVKAAREDIKAIKAIASGRPDLLQAASQMEVDCLIAEKRYQNAKDYAEDSLSSSSFVLKAAFLKISKAIAYDPSGCSAPLKQWALSQS